MNNDESRRALRQLEQTLGIETLLNSLPQEHVKRALKLRSKADLAAELGVPYETLRSWITNGRVPKPEVQLHKRAYFSPEQALAIKVIVTGQRKNKSLTYNPKTG